ncbi:MAG: leucyl aminopeptidase family protein [Geminicoccaceae bacterium]|nr:leucyl aminopeptidase family protein [Geminicoccaceae bacterium]MCX8099918.1 leucyl aminopeptidase family protein [Geminicoccaceae bacterium]MDW8370060.1 leucyl aminopeptidase family protein [Geminicoccaceae bacterium]
MTLPLTADPHGSRPIHLLPARRFSEWLAEQPAARASWLAGIGFEAKPGKTALLPGPDGAPAAAVSIAGEPASLWDVASAACAVPAGTWRLDDPLGLVDPAEAAIGWSLALYRFERYRKPAEAIPRLAVADSGARRRAETIAGSVRFARDLVNTPANELGPAELEAAAAELALAIGASFSSIVGEALLEAGYPLIHVVGAASPRPPRLIELGWGEPDAPRVTLVGKGVCFDTGGLDLKPSSAMLLMKKDMGGAALMLGLTRAIAGLALPVRLRVLIPAVENAVGGRAFRPGDVLRSRKGTTVEIGNTDAEGRLILADALAEADRERPELLIDAATLTGAARVALGPELPALFTPEDPLAAELLAAGARVAEPLWRLPLHAPYRKYLDSRVAEINNAGQKSFAGAITAALFLKEFVSETRAWAHLDVFAWNDESRPGRPKGGEATALRPLLELLERRYRPG